MVCYETDLFTGSLEGDDVSFVFPRHSFYRGKPELVVVAVQEAPGHYLILDQISMIALSRARCLWCIYVNLQWNGNCTPYATAMVITITIHSAVPGVSSHFFVFVLSPRRHVPAGFPCGGTASSISLGRVYLTYNRLTLSSLLSSLFSLYRFLHI